jgi:DNA polymerase III alpha subunit
MERLIDAPVRLDLDFSRIDLNDKKTYHLLGMGLTKGIFQLEEHLGERYTQIVKPQTISDIADITAIIRPGCKESFHVDGETTMLDAYCKIRNKQMEEAYLHEDLRPILGPTHSVLIYQEQIIEICRVIAGLSMKDADMVRYAMGKKRIDLMEIWKPAFIDGCVKQGYEKELGEKLWLWCEKASGYLFNKSHAVAYATIAFKTAYAKCHYPTQFYAAMLKYADKKTDTYEEMLALVNDAKLFAIRIIPPIIKEANAEFKILDKHTIAYGIRYLKGIGDSAIEAIQRTKGASTWIDFLTQADRFKVDKTACEALIKSGVLDEYNEPRTQMMAEYEIFRALSKIEQSIVLSLVSGKLHPSILIDIDTADFDVKRTVTKYLKWATTGIFDICGCYGPIADLDLPEAKEGGWNYDFEHAIYALVDYKISNSKRAEKISKLMEEYRSKGYGINRGLHQAWEKFYFGIPLTVYDKGLVVEPDTIPCIQVINLPGDANVKIAGIIENVGYTKIKRGDSKGKTMAFIDLADNSYLLRGCIAFSECYEKYGENILKGTAVSILGRKMKDGNSIIVNCVKRL